MGRDSVGVCDDLRVFFYVIQDVSVKAFPFIFDPSGFDVGRIGADEEQYFLRCRGRDR